MKRLIFLLQDYFGFSQIEARGFVVLIFLMLILLLVPLLLRYFLPSSQYTQKDYQEDLAMLNNTIKEFELTKQQQDTTQEENSLSSFPEEIENMREVQLFAFNPNELDATQWKALGLKPYLAERIVKYKSKGGSFKVKSDLMKIYGFPAELYQRLYKYIQLPDSQEQKVIEYKQDKSQINTTSEKADYTKEDKPNYKEKFVIQPFDINTVDTAQLKQIKGIGSVLAERIVKFRDKLGGFYAVEQVKEVYGLKDEVYQELEKYAKTSKGFEVKRININTADINELKSHPYIGYKNAQIIINYRQQHGKFANAEDLLKTKSIDETQLNKLKMYLRF